jgi:hypothetical protein
MRLQQSFLVLPFNCNECRDEIFVVRDLKFISGGRLQGTFVQSDRESMFMFLDIDGFPEPLQRCLCACTVERIVSGTSCKSVEMYLDLRFVAVTAGPSDDVETHRRHGLVILRDTSGLADVEAARAQCIPRRIIII